MLVSARVSVTIVYTPAQGPDVDLPSVDESITGTLGSKLSGTGDQTGGIAEKTEPNADGAETTTRTESDRIPPGGVFKQAKLTISGRCDGGESKMLTLSGEGVSVTARVEGNCLLLTQVTLERNAKGQVQRVTTNKRTCCPA